MEALFVILLMCPALAIVLYVLSLVNRIVVAGWLGTQSPKWTVLADCLDAWLLKAWRLPGRMKAHGIRCWRMAYLLALLSPVCLFVFSTIPWIYRSYVPFPLGEQYAPYTTHTDIAGLTGLDDLPAFHFAHGDAGILYNKHRTFYFTFDKPLSTQYMEKLKTLCADADNAFWTNDGDTCFMLHKAWDGSYIKLPIKTARRTDLDNDQRWLQSVTLTIDKNGFTMRPDSIWVDLSCLANCDSISKMTGVHFPEYTLVNADDSDYPYTTVTMMLDQKPSAQFIHEIEASPGWKKENDSTYICEILYEGINQASITVVKNSRVVKHCEYIGRP